MPKASVHENEEFGFGKRNIRSPTKILHRAKMQFVATAKPKQNLPDARPPVGVSFLLTAAIFR